MEKIQNKDKQTLTIIRDLAVTPGQFYTHLLEDLCATHNKKRSKDKQISKDDIKRGLKITNGESEKYKRVEYIVDEAVKNTVFQVTVNAWQMSGFTRYELERSKKGVKVKFIETLPDNIAQYKFMPLRKFGEMTTLARMSKSIMDWERKQIMERENTAEPPTIMDVGRGFYKFFMKVTGKKDPTEEYRDNK